MEKSAQAIIEIKNYKSLNRKAKDETVQSFWIRKNEKKN
jgi:hypothetical protein